MSTFRSLQQVRPANIIGGAVFAGLGVALYSRYMVTNAHADSGAPKKIFSGGLANVSLRLESSEEVNHNTKRLRFQLPEADNIAGFGLTSSILVFSWPEGRIFPVVRPYTPISSPNEPGVVEFMVKHYAAGKQSTHLHSLSPGSSLRFLATLKGFAWKPNQYPHITLIAGGAGITPAYQLIQGILQNPSDQTKITLVYGVNTDADVLLKPEFDEFAAKFPERFRYTYTVSNPVPGSVYRKGYVTEELLREVMPKEKDTKVFVCGPPAMEEALVGKRTKGGVLERLGYGKDKVHRF
ncbi:oxidoreductase NAD-binding domain-containing protein [Pseudomassariella vexata]|uniref:NADH-cytochrome b5 reductase n=1 Tax=Pseudomassariella vexata TaxID=1141098 RepID=A0A1Y2DAP6_9PEZI|nr:oxidoreductase NAD-binding domain-containing protein [Pseudomassariella vexata]ORY56338.1 oxidoreductase NAD-binding domain-containing protein [Pseudomassariella vexata]